LREQLTIRYSMSNEEMATKSLQEILTETIELRGLNIERLMQLTDIPKRYLLALRDGDYERLPAAPYVRGYLMKIAEALNIDGKILWEIYRDQMPMKKSGLEDRLPINRFAIKTKNKKILVFGIIILLAIIYLGWRGGEFWGTPEIDVTNPVLSNIVVDAPSIKLTGTINPSDKLTINNEEILVSETGRFEKDFPLEPGMNTIEFKVKKFLGKETSVIRQIIYQPQ